ncbi:arginase [Clostridium sp. WILCCON 0269]|uniref:Arginase n=1 Tax=Candidatus Clostridium eludens TaxID=3381663 RepID=A0ABW8SNX4_9CLOT
MHNGISVLGVKMDLGRINRGAYFAPQVIRNLGLLKMLNFYIENLKDIGDLSAKISGELDIDNNFKFDIRDLVPDFEKISSVVSNMISDNYFPLILGGDHSISIGTISGIAKHYENLGVIWYDAHADVNTPETTVTGSIYGMPLAINLGLGYPELVTIDGYSPKVKFENIVFIGTRELDEGEKNLLTSNDLTVFTVNDVKKLGIYKVIERAINKLHSKCDGIHLSFDLDSLNPDDAPGVRTLCPIGLSYEESILALRILNRSKVVTSAEFVELNPFLDVNYKSTKVVIELIKALLVNDNSKI